MKDILFNPSFQRYKYPLGALAVNELTTLKLYITDSYYIHDLTAVVYNEEGKVLYYNMYFIGNDNGYNIYEVQFTFDEPYIYWYYFMFSDIYGTHYIGSSDSLDAVLVDDNVLGFQINVYHQTENNLDWFKGKVMYQIMVDRFSKGGDNPPREGIILHEKWNEHPNYLPVNGEILNNDFFGGDLKGVIDKLDYLKSLNVGIIYLNPIFLSPSNHKYNTSDYLTIDPMFGTYEDFVDLCCKANELGISIILDGVFNHTGDDSIYFNKYGNFPSNGAYQSKKSEYFNWYNFLEYPDEYMSWWGIKTLPSINQNSSFLDFLISNGGVIEKWLKAGARGFRLDVVDELNTKFLEKICTKIKNTDYANKSSIAKDNPKNIIIGEVWEDASNKISYGVRRTYFNGKELDSVMNYPVLKSIIYYLKNGKLEKLVYTLRNEINNFPKNTLDSLMNILSTHDTTRIITKFSRVNFHTLSLKERANYKMTTDEYYNARNKLKLASAILYTIPGVPCIFYGDEAGIEGYKDPFCRKTMPWDSIDEELKNWYTLLGKIRNEKVYFNGIYNELIFFEQVFAFSRKLDNDEIITIVNNGDTDYQYYMESGIDLLTNEEINKSVCIYPQTVRIIKKLG